MRKLIVLLAFIGVTCALPRQSRIVGGESTTIETYPYMGVALGRTWDGRYVHVCAGILVSPYAVVSAAHCYPARAISPPANSARVRLGSTNSSTGGIVHTLTRIIIHPQYEHRLLLNDVAILRLAVPAVYSDKINRARIAGPNYILPTDTVVMTVGWGHTQYEGRPSEVLQHVAVNVIDQQICTERYAYLKTYPNWSHIPDVTLDMICTGVLDVGGKDACNGDSGGPIVHNKDVIVGIISWSYECADAYFPGVSTRVSSHADFIYRRSLAD